MFERTNKVLAILKDFKQSKQISSGMLENLLKIQQFVYEAEK